MIRTTRRINSASTFTTPSCIPSCDTMHMPLLFNNEANHKFIAALRILTTTATLGSNISSPCSLHGNGNSISCSLVSLVSLSTGFGFNPPFKSYDESIGPMRSLTIQVCGSSSTPVFCIISACSISYDEVLDVSWWRPIFS